MKIVIPTIFAVALSVFLLLKSDPPSNVETALRETKMAPEISRQLPSARPVEAKVITKTNLPPTIQELIVKGKTAEAVVRLKAVLTEKPNDELALMALANLYLKDPKSKDRAESLLKKALESNPENRDALEKLLSLKTGPGNAIESLQGLAKENPDSPNIAGAYARSLAHKGRYEDAMGILERAIENPESDAMALQSLSEFAKQLGDPSRATEALERAIARQEEALAQKQGGSGEREKALLRTRAFLAEQLIEGNQFDRAEAVIASIAARDPGHQSLTSLRGRVEKGRRG